MNDQEYTKHYYIEGERICSKIGSGFGDARRTPCCSPVSPISGRYDAIAANLWSMLQRGAGCVGYSDSNIMIDGYLSPACRLVSPQEPSRYFYHSDHLGSSSFITDASGTAIQHLQYLPFGENFVDQHTGVWNTPYKFSGKEKDDETGYSYFGARYYDSDLSVWLSVDPMAGKYPSMSPYAYCANNPVILTDPTGMAPDDWFEDGKGNTMWRNSKAATYKDAGGTVWKNVGENRIIVRGDNATIFTQTEDKNGNLHLHSQTVDFSYANSDGNSSQGKDAVLNMQHSNWSRDAAEEFWAEPTIGNWVSYCFKEVLSQYTDPVLVASGLSVGVVGIESFVAKTVSSNPFKGKTFSQIDEMFKTKGFTTRGTDPLNGKGSYFSPSGTRYYFDNGGLYKKGFESTHIDIWFNGHPSFEKVKYFLDGSSKMYTPLK